MKKLIGIPIAALVLAAGTAGATTIVGSKHDLSTSGPNATFRATNVSQVCVFCHTPHQSESPTRVTAPPLWNHSLSNRTSYGTYSSTTSSTMNANPTDIGGATPTSASVSNMCMSCHDGTVGMGNIYKTGGTTPSNSATLLTGSSLVGTDLSNDHPVNFLYNAALATSDGGLVSPSSTSCVTAGSPCQVPLFNGYLQCASCHNSHDNANGAFLLMSNAGSALCLKCHNK